MSGVFKPCKAVEGKSVVSGLLDEYITSSMVLGVESVFAPGDPQGFGLGLLGKNHFFGARKLFAC